jgi:hypothetical protein
MISKKSPSGALKADTSKHGLQNILATLSLYTELLEQSLSDKNLEAALDTTAHIKKNLERLSDTIGYD